MYPPTPQQGVGEVHARTIRPICLKKEYKCKKLNFRNERKFIPLKLSKLPSLALKERNIKSPTKLKDLKCRMASPLYTRRWKNNSAPLPKSREISGNLTNLSPYTINPTEEQSIIHEKVRVKVLEARMSRFSGFKSPRILLNKLIDHISNNDQYETTDFSEVTDVVHQRNHWNFSRNFRDTSRELSILSL